jgi:hypothetical protein
MSGTVKPLATDRRLLPFASTKRRELTPRGSRSERRWEATSVSETPTPRRVTLRMELMPAEVF